MLIRPVKPQDHTQLLELAKQAGIGMVSLPPDPDVLQKKIECSVRSFAGNPVKPKEETFLFVMENPETSELVGTTGIFAHVGLSRPFYSYKLSTVVQASSELDVYTRHHVLHMVNDYTGATEIGSLFLLPDYRRDGLGSMLSRARYLMLAEFPHLFADTVIAEIRGVNNENGGAPFYDHLAAHFFKMPYERADYISATQGNQFIADLMPRYPIYVNLLPQAAQDVIGKPLKASEAAMRLLMAEGFSYEGYIDVFDAGPTVQAERSHIRAIRKSRKKIVTAISNLDAEEKFLISNTNLPEFRICMDKIRIIEEGAVITPATAEKLKLEIGDAVRFTLT